MAEGRADDGLRCVIGLDYGTAYTGETRSKDRDSIGRSLAYMCNIGQNQN